MHKSLLVAGTIFAGLGVAMGAFGAHGLQNITSDEKIIHGFQTAVQYQIYHALALLITGMLYDKIPHLFVKWAGICFIVGILLFSGSLYLLTMLKIQESGLTKVAGPVTPLGGVFFIAGWLFLLVGVLRSRIATR
jgi:uncharacterized membrane protein YgdD (TMEM256/DUF423 family)